MSASNLFENGILSLVFDNQAFANIGDAAGLQPSAAAGNLYVALYTSDPGETDAGTEATYAGYARQAVPRSTSGWNVSNGVASNAAVITFPQCTGGSETITHFAIRTAASGGDLLFSGALASSLAISSGITPEIAVGGLTISAD